MSIKADRLLSKAYKLINKGENIKAREIFLSILQSFPNNLDAKKGLSLLNQKKEISPSKNEIDEVMQFYSLRQMDKAQSAVQRLLKEFPNDSLLYNISGACFSEAGKIEFAINSFEKALELIQSTQKFILI